MERIIKHYLFYLVVLISIFSCNDNKDDSVIEDKSIVTSWSFKPSYNDGLDEEVTAVISGSKIIVNSSKLDDIERLIPSFEANNAKAYVNGTEIISGQTVLDFTNPVTMYVTNGKVQKAYTIVVNTTGLPVFVIQTPEQKEIQSKDEWLKYCEVCLVDINGVISYQNDSLQIKGRGNSTWEYPKKSYSIKLDKRYSFMGGGKT